MDKDLDMKLYNEYLNGEIKAFEKLYIRYKDKIKYFIYNIIKDYEKAEDITQEVFIYVLKNKFNNKTSFKYYIYMIAKSKAINYFNVENRRSEINDLYLMNNEKVVEEDVLETIIRQEEKEKLMEAIDLLDDKYKNAIYLVKIENFSYKETAEILGETLQNIKNLIHRGKKELRTILVKKGFDEMNKVSKVIVLVLSIGIILSGIVYATTKIIGNSKGKVNLTPVFTGAIGDNDVNSIWVGSFQIAWNEFMNTRVNGNVEFENGESILANELNKQMFSKKMLSANDYYIKVGKTSNSLKNEILSDINSKFGITDSSALNQIDFDVEPESESYTIYSILYKNFNFLMPFDRLYGTPFNNSEEIVEYFGINNASSEELNNNIEVLFYSNLDFAVKLKTKENEDVILYCNENDGSFNTLYDEIEQKSQSYKGNNNFAENDELKVPYINLDTIINYGELCGREIKGTNGLYLTNAVQNVKFSLNETGGNLISEATIKDEYMSTSENSRFFYFNKPFVVFLKESDKNNPYFALKVDNTDLLVNDNF